MQNRLLTRDRMKFQRRFPGLEPATKQVTGRNGRQQWVLIVPTKSCIKDSEKKLFETGRVVALGHPSEFDDLLDLEPEPIDVFAKVKGLKL